MSGPLGKQDESQPATDYDKRMSKVHKAHRKLVDKMKESPEKYEKSIRYNISHRDEHQEALVKSKDRLKQLKKQAKASSKLGR
jgi:hypothetical protein